MMNVPPPIQVDSWQTAEANAAAWMRHWGYSDARVTPPGRDGGIDIRARSALAQVKFEAVQVGTPAVQRLVGARGRDHDKDLLFFSGAGFAKPAVEYADDMDVALFHYDLRGGMAPKSRSAERILDRVRPVAQAADPNGGAHEQLPSTSSCLRSCSGVLGGFLILIQVVVVLFGDRPASDIWKAPPVVVGVVLVLIASVLGGGQPPKPTATESAPPDPLPMSIDAVALHIRAGQKIQAVEAYRDATGVGLAEAKRAVDTAMP